MFNINMSFNLQYLQAIWVRHSVTVICKVTSLVNWLVCWVSISVDSLLSKLFFSLSLLILYRHIVIRNNPG